VQLDQFIKETLFEIFQGGHRAKSATGGILTGSRGEGYSKLAPVATKLSEIEFDIAVTVTEQLDEGGKGGVNLGVIQVAGSGTSSTSETSTHRIRFKVPVSFAGDPDPFMEANDPRKKKTER
jgi:hypothetical protein